MFFFGRLRTPLSLLSELNLAMRPQKASPQAEFRKPTDLVDEFVCLFLMLSLIPDHPIVRLAMGDSGCVYRRWERGHCVDARRTHTQQRAIEFPYLSDS